MENLEYRSRIIDEKVKLYLSTFGAVCIEGPKWCGKTWTSRHHSKSEFLVGDPEGNFQNRRLAQVDVTAIFPGETPRLIDEWQEVPEIWDAVRYKVDEKRNKGQFILTGSSTPKYKGILHSGAGRIAKLKMSPMSLYESGDSSGKVSLKDLYNNKVDAQLTGTISIEKLVELVIRGGWPESIGTNLEQAVLLPRAYIEAILQTDIQKIDDGRTYDTNKVRLLMRSLARNESTTVTNKSLKNDVKAIDDQDIDVDTIASYLDVLSRMFLIQNQKPYSNNIRSKDRVKQAEKRHFVDPSIAVAMLELNKEALINDLNYFGFLFESMCERDLNIYAESLDAHLYHYQDYNDREVDAIIEFPGGDYIAIEIKLGAKEIDEGAKNLLNFKNSISSNEKPPKSLIVICGMSNSAYKREDGIIVVPITALKP